MAVIKNITRSSAFYCEAKKGEALPDASIAPGPISDLRFEFSFTYEGTAVGLPAKLNCFTSYKKHLSESYENIGDYKPTAATVNPKADPLVQAQQDKNTLTSLSRMQFKDAFEQYGDFLIGAMSGKDTATLAPDSLGPFLTAQGIMFTNNNDKFYKPFHCFPQHKAGSTVSVDLTGRQLMDFVYIMKFRERGLNVTGLKSNAVNSELVGTEKLYAQYRKEEWFRMLTSKPQRQQLRDTFEKLPERIKQLKEAEGKAKMEASKLKTATATK